MLETSHSLLERLQQSANADSWDELVALYGPLLRSWLRRYSDLWPEDVDDLVQDALTAVAENIADFEHNERDGAFRSWLRTILVHRLRRFWEKRQRRPTPVGGTEFHKHLEELADDSSQLCTQWDREHDLYVLHNLLAAVKPQFEEITWRAFHRQLFDGIKAADVAAELGLSRDSVYAAKSRVLMAMRQAAAGIIE